MGISYPDLSRYALVMSYFVAIAKGDLSSWLVRSLSLDREAVIRIYENTQEPATGCIYNCWLRIAKASTEMRY